MSRRVCVVTGSRAEYGLLRWVMEGIQRDPRLSLQVVATGMHLSPEFGLTYREIEKDGFHIDARVEMLLSSDTPVGVAKSIGLGVIGFADALASLRPDVLLVLGDRFETLAAATAAMVERIPIAHAHGGETTEGAIDESIRHSITKMAHLHFVATEEYRRRVVQLGEHPERVFNFGALGLDGIARLSLLERSDLEHDIGIHWRRRNLLVTFHPATLEDSVARLQFEELLAALDGLDGVTLIFTKPNADTDGRALISMIDEFVARHDNAHAFTSLGQLRYLSCLRHVDGVVGNSSSGLIEAPSFRVGTINVGDRQRGRIKAASVMDCAAERGAIRSALERLYSREFQSALRSVENPYGQAGASAQIVEALAVGDLRGFLMKRFFDLPPPC